MATHKCLIYFNAQTAISYAQKTFAKDCQFKKASKFSQAKQIFKEFLPDIIICEVLLVMDVIKLIKQRKARVILIDVSFIIDIDPVTECANVQLLIFPYKKEEIRIVQQFIQATVIELTKIIPIKKLEIYNTINGEKTTTPLV